MSVLRFSVPQLSGNSADDEYALGAGTGAKISVAASTTVLTLTSSATPSINTNNYQQVDITALAVNITSMTTNLSGTPTDGETLLIRIKDNGSARTITWGSKFSSSGIATLLSTTSASKTHMVGLIYDSVKAAWVCMAVDATGY